MLFVFTGQLQPHILIDCKLFLRIFDYTKIYTGRLSCHILVLHPAVFSLRVHAFAVIDRLCSRAMSPAVSSHVNLDSLKTAKRIPRAAVPQAFPPC